MSPPGSTELGVILVNFRSVRDVEARLRSPALVGARVVVVDNGSDPDETVRLCRETGAEALILPTNMGFAAGVNAGIAALGEVEQLLLLNPDAELSRAELQALREALRAYDVDGVAPLLVEPTNRLQVGAAGGPLSAWSFAVYFLGLAHIVPRARGIFLTRRQSVSASTVDWLCAACLLLRGDAIARFGLFPIDELVYAEDVAWGTRASRAGARFRLIPSVRVLHRVGGSGEGGRWSGALERLAQRRLNPWEAALAVVALRTGLVLRALVRSFDVRDAARRRRSTGAPASDHRPQT